jgi:hypothetical protein
MPRVSRRGAPPEDDAIIGQGSAVLLTLVMVVVGCLLYLLKCWKIWIYGIIELLVSILVIFLSFSPAIIPGSALCLGWSIFGYGCLIQSHLPTLIALYIFVRGMDNVKAIKVATRWWRSKQPLPDEVKSKQACMSRSTDRSVESQWHDDL